MAWECPYLEGPDLFCAKLDKPCEPVQKGCVLYGKVRRVNPPTSDGPPRQTDGEEKAQS